METSHTPMTFFIASDTPLLFAWWRPSSNAHYAVTCLILMLLAASFRALLSGKHILERRWSHQHQEKIANRFNHIPLAKYNKQSEVSSNAPLDADSIEEQIREVNRAGTSKQPWRLSVDLPRALLVTLISVLGYFLMLAVMTSNVGYFCSVIGGIFAGELLVGRYNRSIPDH